MRIKSGKEILREDIKILMRAGVGIKYKQALLDRGFVTEQDLITDVWCYIVSNKSESIAKYQANWFYNWDADDEELRRHHQGWIKLYIKGYLKDEVKKQKRKLNQYHKYMNATLNEEHKDEYQELCNKVDEEKQINFVESLCITDLDRDLCKWQSGECTLDQLVVNHKTSIRTLKRKWNKLKERIVGAYNA